METLKTHKNQSVIKLEAEELILTNWEYFPAILKDIREAKHTIYLSTYILKQDELGHAFSKALSQAAARGVKVRLLIDGVGSRFLNYAFIQSMKEHGVHVKIYHPLPFPLWQIRLAAHVPSQSLIKNFFYLLTKMNDRNHRKLCLIDDSIIYISSANIDRSHIGNGTDEKAWRDTSVRLVGFDVSLLREAFFKTWNYTSRYHEIKKDEKENPFILNYTRKERRQAYKNMLSQLALCKRRIWITKPYFAPDAFILKTLITASKKNIDIRILLPGKSDVLISTLVANTFYSLLLKNGIAIYEYLPSILHAKTMILDDAVTMGSSNLNTRSLKHDLEIDIKLQTKKAKQIIEKQFINDIAVSQKIKLSDLEKQSFIKTFLGRMLLFFHYWI